MAEEKPGAAMGVSVAGGIIILLVGIPLIFLLGLGLVAIVCGIIIIAGASAAYSNPESATGWGVTILVLSMVSWVGGGGALIGFLLALIGGILFLTWKPPAPVMYYPPGAPPPYGYPPPYGQYPQHPQQAYAQHPQQAYAQYPQQAYPPQPQQPPPPYGQPQPPQPYGQPQPPPPYGQPPPPQPYGQPPPPPQYPQQQPDPQAQQRPRPKQPGKP